MSGFLEALESRLLWSADLAGSFAGRLPTALEAAHANHVSVRVSNAGDRPANGLVSVALYASPTAGPDPAEVLLATSTRSIPLRPGRSASVSLRFRSPSNLPDGSYYLVAQLGADATLDSNPANDTTVSSQPVAIRQPFVDLTGQFTTFPIGPADVNNGSFAEFGVRVMNRGNVPAAGPLSVSFYASPDGAFDASDTLIAVAAQVVRIRPGGSQPMFAQVRFPSGFATGNYFVFAQVDSAQAFTESDESNNVIAGPRQLIAANVPAQPVVDRRGHQHHHHHDNVIVPDGGAYFFGGAFIGGWYDATDLGGSSFIYDSSPPPDSAFNDQPTTDSSPPPDTTQPTDGSDGWGDNSSTGSDF